MNDRPDLPRIHPDEPVSFFNREAGGWGLLGNTLGGVAAAVSLIGQNIKNAQKGIPVAPETMVKSLPLIISITLGATAIGTIFGGLKGMDRQKREKEEGRVVKTPTGWNSGIWGGWLGGILLAIPVRMAHIHGVIGAKAAFITGAVLEIGGMIVGSNLRKSSMERDFNKAIAQRNQEIGALKEQTKMLEQTVAPGKNYKNSVSAEESQALEGKLAGGNLAEPIATDRAATPEAAR